jgi:transcription-repair coupling factor (superfamily II helicase)
VQGNKIVLQGEMKTEAERIKGAFAIARDLAEKAKATAAAPAAATRR